MMALVETTRSTAGFGAFLTTLRIRFADWQAIRATRKALESLDEHELADIGLNRADVAMMSFTRRG
jgi:uncharacterized protein YjiS (DUF1127 family)